MSFDVNKFGKKSGIELNTLNAGMKKTDIEEKNTAGHSIFDTIDTDKNGVIDETEIDIFRKNIDKDNNNTISKKEAKKYLEENKLEELDKKEVLKFLAGMIDNNKDIKEAKIITQNGEKIVQVEYKDGTIDLINGDKSYSHITTDENGNTITEEFDKEGKLEKKTVKDKNNNISAKEYEQDGTTVKQETIINAETGEITTIQYNEGKPASKEIKKGVVTTRYEITQDNNWEKKSQIINDGSGDKQKETIYQTNPDGTITAVTTDALNPDKKIVKTIVKNGDKETVSKEVITEGNKTTERTYTNEGMVEITATQEGTTETRYNNENKKLSQTKIINGKEYTVEYDENGNTKLVLQNGESIDMLAKKFGITKSEILEANNGKIRGWAGDEIVIPGELEADDNRLQNRQTAQEAKSAYKKTAEEIEQVNQKAAARKKITFTEKIHNTWEDVARGLFKGEGIENPTKQQLQKRIAQLKEANPDIKDGEIKGKRITAPVAEEVHSRVAAKENKRKEEIKAKQKSEENIQVQKESAKQITDELIKATKWINDQDKIQSALTRIDNPDELAEVNRLLEEKGYKGDTYYSPIEKFMSKEMSGSKFYDKSFDKMEEIVQKWIANGTLTGDDAINAQARLAARLIIDGCDGFGTDVEETKEGVKLIKAPAPTGDAAVDKANAQKVYDKVNEIIKNHKSFGASFKDLKDYLSGDLWDSEIKYLDGILAENNAIQGEQKSQAVKNLVQEAVEGAGTDIEYLKQAIKGINTREDRLEAEKLLKEYCEKKGIKPQIEGQDYLQAILYDECDTFLGISTDHKEIRKFNEMLIAQGAYTQEEAAKLRAEQAALQILDGSFSDIQNAVEQIKDKAVLEQLNSLLAKEGKDKGYSDLETYLQEKGYSQTQSDLVFAELASRKLIDINKAANVALRLVQNSDYDTRAMGFKAITSSEIALAIDKELKAKGQSLSQIIEQFNKEKAQNKEKAAFWDKIAGVMGGFNPLGYAAEHISDEYNENTELSDNLYTENKTPVPLTEQQRKSYEMTVQAFEEQLNKMKEDYQAALESQGVVSGALNAFCSVYNIGTTRDDIEARIAHDEETLKLLKLASEGKLAKIENGKTTSVSFEDVFKERASEFITANGGSISAIRNKKNPKEITEFSVEKVEKVAKKAETIAAMSFAKDNIAVCWDELNKGLNSGDNRELAVAIYNTMEKLSQMSGQQLSLDGLGYKVSNGTIVDSAGKPVSTDKLKEIANQLKQGLSDVSSALLGVSIPADTDNSDVSDILNDAYDNKMDGFKQEYRDAFGQQASDEMIENYMKTINYSKMAVNFGLLIGAAIAAPFTGGGSLAVFAATAGVSFGMNALEKSTDADGYTNSEWTADMEQAMWDGALTAIGFKVGQMADAAAQGGKGFLAAAKESNKWIAKAVKNLPADKAAKVEATLAKLSQLTNTKAAKISENLLNKNTAYINKIAPGINPASAQKASVCLSRIEALGFEVSSDTIQSLLQTYCQEGEFHSEAFMQGLIMSVIGNAAGHAFSAIGDMKTGAAGQMLQDIKGIDGKTLFTVDEIDDILKNNPQLADLSQTDITNLQQKIEIFAQMKTPDGKTIFSQTELHEIVKNNPAFIGYSLDEVRALNDKISELSTLKDTNGNVIFSSDEISNIVKAGGANISEIPADTFRILAGKDKTALPVLLANIKSADDAKLINILIGAENTKLSFNIADLEDILEAKHNSQLTDFNAFALKVTGLDLDRGQLFPLTKENYPAEIVEILNNIKTDIQRQAFETLESRMFSGTNESASYGSSLAAIMTSQHDLEMLDKLLDNALASINNDKLNSLKAILSGIQSRYPGNNDLGEFAKEILYKHFQENPKFLEMYAEKKIPEYIYLPSPHIKYSELDKELLFKMIESGDYEKISFVMRHSKLVLDTADTPLMRHFRKTGKIPAFVSELEMLKTNSPLQEKAFETILEHDETGRFESFTYQEIINNIKTQQDLDNLKKLLDMNINGKQLSGQVIIDNLKKGTIDIDDIRTANAPKGIPYSDDEVFALGDKYNMSTVYAHRLLKLRSSNLKRYNKIVDSGLLDLIKDGKVNIKILQNIDENTFLSNRTLKDIRKIANGESLITTLKNPSELSNISKYVENGEVCELNEKLYINDNGNAVEIKLSRQKFEELFPPLSRVSFEQGNIGDCWLVSTIDNLLDLPGGRVALYKLFEQQGDDILIKFPGVAETVKFPGGKTLKSPTDMQVSSPAANENSEGIKIIEQAFAVHRLRNGARAYNVNSPVTDISTFANVDELMERIISGSQEEALKDFFGKDIPIDYFGTDFSDKNIMNQLIRKYANDENVFISFGTIATKGSTKVEELLSAKYDIYSRHAYAIKGYDEKTGMVYITNPHHTSVITEIPMHELIKYMSNCTIADITTGAPKIKPALSYPQQAATNAANTSHALNKTPKSQNMPEFEQSELDDIFDFDDIDIDTKMRSQIVSKLKTDYGFDEKSLENIDSQTASQLEQVISQIDKNAYLYKNGDDSYKVNLDEILESVDDLQTRNQITDILKQNPQYKSYLTESYTSPELKNLPNIYGRSGEEVAADIRKNIQNCQSLKDIEVLTNYTRNAYNSTGIKTPYDGIFEQIDSKRQEIIDNAFTGMRNLADYSLLPSAQKFRTTIEQQIAQVQNLDEIQLLRKDLSEYKAHTTGEFTDIETLINQKQDNLLNNNIRERLENAQHLDEVNYSRALNEPETPQTKELEALAAQKREHIKANALAAEKDFLDGRSIPEEATMKDIIRIKLEDCKTPEDLEPLMDELKLYDQKTGIYHGEINKFIMDKRTELRLPVITDYKSDILTQLKSCDTEDKLNELRDNYAKFKEINTTYGNSKTEQKLFEDIDNAFNETMQNIETKKHLSEDFHIDLEELTAPKQNLGASEDTQPAASSRQPQTISEPAATAPASAQSSRGFFARLRKFSGSLFSKNNQDLLNSTKISDKISALGNITNMYGSPKFSAAELDKFQNLLKQYKQMGHKIDAIPLNTMFAVASMPTVKNTDDVVRVLINANSPDKIDMLNKLVNTNNVSVQNGIAGIPKSNGAPDVEFINNLLGFTKYDAAHTGKVKLLEEIMNPNGPIRPAISKFDQNTASQIAEILNRAETAEDVDMILNHIENFKKANSSNTTLNLSELNTVIDLGNAIKTGHSSGISEISSSNYSKKDIQNIINRMNYDSEYGMKYFPETITPLLDNFDYNNAERHLKNLKKVFENDLSVETIINKGWLSSLEGAQAFEEASQIFSFSHTLGRRSSMDMILSYMSVQEWQNAKRAGLIDYARTTGIDYSDFIQISKLPENKIRALINSGLASMGIKYISDNNDINQLFRNIAGRSKQGTYNIISYLNNLENLIKQTAGNDPAKIKELSKKLQTLDDKFLNNIINYYSVPMDLDYYINNVENIYKKMQHYIKDFDDTAFTGDFTALSHIITRENAQIFEELVTLDGIDQKKLYNAISYADTPAKVHHLQVIIDKIKSGEESIIALPFVKHSEVNPRIAQAKYAQLPKFEAGTNPASLVTSTKQGQVIAIGNKTYINDRGKMVELDISADTYEKLFPPYESLCIRQGDETGDCYFLSGGLIAFMKNDYARINLLKLIKQEGNDIVITFPAFPQTPVRFNNGNIKLQNLHAETSLGNLMLEQAYAKARYAKAHNISDASKVDTDKAMEFIYGGHESAVFNEILGNKNSIEYIMESYSDAENKPAKYQSVDKDKMFAILDKYAGRDDVLLCGGSGARDGGYLPEYGVSPRHAYCIEKIDSQNKTVTIINPYNSLYCMTITYDQFTEYFASLAVRELQV